MGIKWMLALVAVIETGGCGVAPPDDLTVPNREASMYAIASEGSARERITAYLERSSPDHYPKVEALRVREAGRGLKYTFTAIYRVVGFTSAILPHRFWVQGTYSPATNTVEVTERHAQWRWMRPATLDHPPR
ncbi:MAG: hypothetical protein ACK46X_11755 [Candidatus Sericytochromatia bacterium]